MINLKVENSLIVLPADASISIEKNSPVLNDVGSFSYPFPVSTIKNQKTLGYPGRSERANSIQSKNFILDENGVKVLSGEIDFDEISDLQTGLILQSGATEFSKKTDGKLLSALDFGSELFPFGALSDPACRIQLLLDSLSEANNIGNGKYVCFPFCAENGGQKTIVNQTGADGNIGYNTNAGAQTGITYYCFQFYLHFILQKIYESAGYVVVKNDLIDSEFTDVVIFSKILRVAWGTYYPESGSPSVVVVSPDMPVLKYGDLMPDEEIADFLKKIKKLLCLSIDVDERLRTVSITFIRSIFQEENKVTVEVDELTGRTGKELKNKNGFILKYKSQDDDLATEHGFEIAQTVATFADLDAIPFSYSYNSFVKVAANNRIYKAVMENGGYSWKGIGRIASYQQLGGEEPFEIEVKIPDQIIKNLDSPSRDVDMPYLDIVLDENTVFINIDIYATIWRGMINFITIPIPSATFDHKTLDGVYTFETSLKPAYLYETVYRDFINWKTYRARECTKYLNLPLTEVVQLQFRKRYVISGIPIILNQINFEIPYRGVVKVNGFTT